MEVGLTGASACIHVLYIFIMTLRTCMLGMFVYILCFTTLYVVCITVAPCITSNFIAQNPLYSSV